MLKKFMTVCTGSIFIQVFCWAMYDFLKMQIWMCGLSVILSAILYHFLQIEEQTGLSRRKVFFASILTPFLLGLLITVAGMLRHPNLNLMGASLDGVSPMTELISLYAARLVINGIILLFFAAADSVYLRAHAEEKKPA